MPRHLALLLLALPCSAFAQIASDSDALASETADDRWSLGVGVSLRDSPYAGEGTRVRPLPIVTYEGERLFWRGLSGGVHLMRGGTFTLDALLSGRFDGFDIDDLGRTELARNGLDVSLLEDRDDGLDAGLAATWRGAAGEFKLRALADVTDTSGGYEFAADYGYPLQFGRTTVVPGVGVRWMSSDLVDYYYGTQDEEVARGVPRYQPGSAMVPQVSVAAVRPLGRKWKLLGSVEYRFLPDEISDSPLVEPDTDGSARLMIGISRGF
jgi:outer membrane protein